MPQDHPFPRRFFPAAVIGLGLIWGNAAFCSDAGQQTTLSDIPFADADPAIGAEINEVCAGCHGADGQGGKAGEYPRLAGLPATFIARQLLLFRDRSRKNLAMVEYVDDRQMPDEDIAHISVFLSEVDLPSRLPPVDDEGSGINAYQRLLDAERVVQIPPAPGDATRGAALYRRECASCHGRDGQGAVSYTHLRAHET